MGIRKQIICDCCNREIEDMQYYIEVKPQWTTLKARITMQEEKPWLICEDCLKAIGEKVREQRIDIEIRMDEYEDTSDRP